MRRLVVLHTNDIHGRPEAIARIAAANLQRDGRVVPGAVASALLDAGGVRVGLIGLTPTDWRDIYASIGLELPGELPLVETHAAAEVGPPASRIHGRLPHTAVLGDVDRAAGGAG